MFTAFRSSRVIKACAAVAVPLAIAVQTDRSNCQTVTLNLSQIKREIVKAIEAEDDKREDGTSIAPTLIRLAWHSAGTYSCRDKTGGCTGAHMRFSPEKDWGANAGLQIARDVLEPIKANHPISYSDLWTLAGVISVEYMGGPKVAWRPGRPDSKKPTTVPDGRLPSAVKRDVLELRSHIRDVFERMGFNDRETVALIGAHCVGRCHVEASGYWGPWTRAETTFSNEYFKLLLSEDWTLKTTHEGKKWTGPQQFESADKSLMMLPADMLVVLDPVYRVIAQEFAASEEAFFKEFASAFAKLLELGVKFPEKK